MEEGYTGQEAQRVGRRPVWVWLIILVLLGIVALLGWGLVQNSAGRPEVGDPLPDFELTLYDGYGYEGRQTIDEADLSGKVVVLNFWASWCVECTYEAADLEAIWQSYPQDEVVVLGVAYIDEEGPSLDFLERFALSYPNGADLGSTLSEDKYFITGVPETFIFGPDGTLIEAYIGPVEENELRAVIDPLLR
ncbi:MAG: TlpA disulfide reductase family protein [Ardenticatenaceae bacterium]|nr:TlpA disulfide reductase family protein [Ardenticatenaceae bacterium]